MAYGAWHLYQKAYTTLVNERKIDINVLMALVNTAYIGSGYWLLGNLTTTSYFLSTRLISGVKERLQADLISALTQQPRLVWMMVDGKEAQQPFEKLQVGDVVVIHAGEILPVDGVVCAGAGTVDEHMLTGEARPVEKSVGERAFTATLLISGQLFIRVEQAGAETMVQRINAMLAQTVDFR